MDSLNKRFCINKNIVIKDFKDESIILNLENENILKTNKTCKKIIDLINQNMTLKEILEILAKEYNIESEFIKEELLTTIKSLLSHNIIEEN